MTINKAYAGTLESSDIFVEIEPAAEGTGIELKLTSAVYKQFGPQIEEVILETLKVNGIENAKVTANDRGAVDCTIRARVEVAALRAKGEV